MNNADSKKMKKLSNEFLKVTDEIKRIMKAQNNVLNTLQLFQKAYGRNYYKKRGERIRREKRLYENLKTSDSLFLD